MQGVGAAAMSPLTLSIVVAAFPAERRAGAIGIWAAVGRVGFGSGPVVRGFLVDRFDWSAVFWVNVPSACCAADSPCWRWPSRAIPPPAGSTAGERPWPRPRCWC